MRHHEREGRLHRRALELGDVRLVAHRQRPASAVSRDYGATWRVVANLDGTASNWAMVFGGGGALIVNAADRTTVAGMRGGRTTGPII